MNVADRDYVIGRGLAAIDGLSVRQDYLEQYLFFVSNSLKNASQGSTFEAINSGELSTWPILYPAAGDEQAKVAEVLTTLNRVIEQTAAMIAKGHRMTIGLVHDLITRGVDEAGNVRSEVAHRFKSSPFGRIPDEWEVMPIGEVANIIDPNPSHRYPTPTDVGVPIASTENFEGEDDFDLRKCDLVSASVFDEQFSRCNYKDNDVVFARKGRLGFARPYGSSKKVFSHTVVIMKAKREADLCNEFLLWTVRDRSFFAQIDKRMNSNSGVPTLGIRFLSAIPIRVPKPEEQKRIAQVISQQALLVKQKHESLRKLRMLKTGLMQDLLTGKKRVTALLEAEPQRERAYA